MNKKNILFICTLLFVTNIFSQQDTTLNSDPRFLFSQAEEYLLNENYEKAIPLYKQLIVNNPQNSNWNFKLGICYLYSPSEYSKAISCLEKAVVNTANNTNDESFKEERSPLLAIKFLADAYHRNYRFTEAIDTYNKFLNALQGNAKVYKEEIENQITVLKEKYKERFYLVGKITVTTDVVAENNQTNRLGWSEKCKDGTKMGVGLPEYILIFRKPPSHEDNSYADNPVTKSKFDYIRAQWQLDAHAYWRSSGNRLIGSQDLQEISLAELADTWKRINKTSIYDFNEHLSICSELDSIDKLSTKYMSLPVHSNNPNVWTDIVRMNTLNTKQVSSKKEKHICPLQLDIIERLIDTYSMEGDIIDDPFGGLQSTAYKSIEMNRHARSCELNTDYFYDGVYYVKAKNDKLNAPTLFDILETKVGKE